MLYLAKASTQTLTMSLETHLWISSAVGIHLQDRFIDQVVFSFGYFKYSFSPFFFFLVLCYYSKSHL